jgi:precorrin-8X/cobalt-precorrin-8 methylmutase
MALFDGYLMVDWSGAGTPVTGKDSIWVADLGASGLTLTNPPTRSEARAHLAQRMARATQAGERLLIGFDFPFGYPSGLAQAIAANGDWRTVWAWLADQIEDGPDNANNRFDVAARLNGLFDGEGPFWGNGLKRDIPGLPRKKPSGWGETLPANLRHADAGAPAAQEVWKLAGVGSVGGQALTGIAALERLRRETGASVWPFETLGEGQAHVLAEVFPSLIAMDFPDGAVRDAVQVETLTRAMARLDAQGDLAALLGAPADAPAQVRSHEATILGLSHQAQLAQASRPARQLRYEKNPEAIYAESFATVEREARLDRFDPGMAAIATRVIHACGMVEIADRLSFSPGVSAAAETALQGGAPILCDCEMVAAGIIRRFLPGNEVVVTLNDASVPARAAKLGTTRSAAAVELWRAQIEGALVVIGNAPTALFHLLERLDEGWPRPAAILAFPVGFVGAAESKAELAARPRGCEFVTLRGRRGGSAMASAALNAVAVRSSRPGGHSSQAKRDRRDR